MPVSLIEAKELREQRGPIVKEMQDLITKAHEEKRSLSSEEQTRWDKLDSDQKEKLKLAEQIEHLHDVEGVHDLRHELDKKNEYDRKRKQGDGAVTIEDTRNAWRAWCMAGNQTADIPEQFIRSAKKTGMNLSKRSMKLQLQKQAPSDINQLREQAHEALQTRATTYQTITTTGGGHVIQNEAMAELEIALLAHGGMREAARVIRTQTGATLPWPTMDDSTNKSAILAISTEADINSLVFGQAELSAYKYTTKRIMVPIELMQDEAVNLPAVIGNALGVRAAKGTNYHFTVGVSSDTQPSGVVTDSIEGSTGSDVNAVTYSELVTLQHAVDPAYRADPSCRWMFNDNTLGVLKKLVDGDSRPLWQAGLAIGSPDMILGKPYTINQDMASIAASTAGTGGAKAILFGAFNRYIIRDVRDIIFLRLDERYAEMGMTAFLAFHRHDGLTIQASTVTAPIMHFVTKST